MVRHVPVAERDLAAERGVVANAAGPGQKGGLDRTHRAGSRTGVRPAVLLALAAIAAAALLASCSRSSNWVAYRGLEGQGATSDAVYPPFGVKWKLRLQEGGKPLDAFNPPVILGNSIYFGSADGNFYSLNLDSGYMNWVFKTGGPINSIPSADGKYVYFGSEDGKVYAVNRQTGKEAWSFQTSNPVRSTVVRYHNSVIFTSDGGSTYNLTPEGVLRYKLPNPVWYYDTFQVYKDVIYFAPGPPSNPSSFGAYDLRSRAYLWILDTSQLNAYWYSFPALRGNSVYFATSTDLGPGEWHFDYYAYNRVTGQIMWKDSSISQWGPGGPGNAEALFTRDLRLLDYMAPSLWRNLVIYTSGDSVVRAFRTSNGQLAWEHKFPYPTSSAPTIAGGRVYFGLDGDPHNPKIPPELVCLSARNGDVLWTMKLEGAMLSAPVISGKWIVFGTDQSYFYVLEALY